MACAWNPHVVVVGSWKHSSSIEKNIKKRRFPQFQKSVIYDSILVHDQGWEMEVSRLTVQFRLKWNGEASHSGKLFNHDDRLGETRKKANCSTLLKRIAKIEIVNSEIKSKGPTSYLNRYSGILQRAHAILSNRRESHTCSELSLRILWWNAS